jgi:hypothetical protein
MQTTMLTTVSLLVAVTAASAQSVRTDEPRLRALFERGLERSATFQSLVSVLSASDVIAYVTTRPMRDAMGGYTSHTITVGGGHRYVRIAINPRGADRLRVAVIAHELQHAIEIARAPDVGRSRTAAQLWTAIGLPRLCPFEDCYETVAAMTVQRTVLDELGAWNDDSPSRKERRRIPPPSLMAAGASARATSQP